MKNRRKKHKNEIDELKNEIHKLTQAKEMLKSSISVAYLCHTFNHMSISYIYICIYTTDTPNQDRSTNEKSKKHVKNKKTKIFVLKGGTIHISGKRAY